ncbi:MAG: cysteine synthase family protein [Actinobacteria bacterium]|nr:MAG: cysteine synthase family protein [Actinomycetota bacterium]
MSEDLHCNAPEHAGLGDSSALARYDDQLDCCGDVEHPTPIVRINRMLANPDATLYIKCEWVNPFGSIKDRTAKWLLKGLAERGELEGRTVVEATSGNTGIALAAICSQIGVPMIATAPHVLSPEKSALLRAFGADVRLTDPADASGLHPMDVAFKLAESIVASDPEKYVMPNQYDNPDNARAHYESTGPEIWAQTEGCIRYFFAGLGTCGTMVGTSRYLKEQDPSIVCVAIEPVPGHHISGLKNQEETAVPGNMDASFIDEIVWVDDAMTDECARRLYREEALMVGPSAAAIAAGAMKYLSEAGRSGVAVAIAPDSGQKAASYLNAILE